MAHFTVKALTLPHNGIIPGARGHKKIVVPEGTRVYCIVHDHRFFWAAYLDEPTALQVAASLDDTADGRSKRPISLATLLDWNFRYSFPTRICRPASPAPRLIV